MYGRFHAQTLCLMLHGHQRHPKENFVHLHPNTILKPNPDPTATPTLSLVLTQPLPLIKTEYWDRAGGGGNISYDWRGTSRMIHTLMALDKVKSACK